MKVFIQNQVGHKPRRWDKTGVIVECKDFDQYVVKVDGTGRLTLRNRKFLRKLMPIQKKTVQDARKTVLKPALLPASPRPAQHHPVTQNRDYAELPLGYQQGAGQPQDHLQPIQPPAHWPTTHCATPYLSPWWLAKSRLSNQLQNELSRWSRTGSDLLPCELPAAHSNPRHAQ